MKIVEIQKGKNSRAKDVWNIYNDTNDDRGGITHHTATLLLLLQSLRYMYLQFSQLLIVA